MAKVAVLVADVFQDSEYFVPKIEIEKLGVKTGPRSQLEQVSLNTK